MTGHARSFFRRYGPWAVVAGAARGLGAEFAFQLAARSVNLVLVDRLAGDLQQISRGIELTEGVRVRTVVADLADDDAVARVREQTDELDPGLLICNAASSSIGPFLGQPVERHLESVDVNCRTAVALVHHFGGRMADRGRGGIILMSSFSGFVGSPMVAHHAATKAYSLVLAEGLWDELGPSGVDVLAVCPGPTRTPGYLSSMPARSRFFAASEMEPSEVVASALEALGRRSCVIPGRVHRWVWFLLHRALPRQWAVRLVGRTTRAMYGGRTALR